MSSRCNSTITTNMQGSHSPTIGNHNEFEGDTSMADTTNASIEDERRVKRETSESVPTSSYIQRSPLLDIAFLHSISTHRPLGPHKHFNLIPVLTFLDRTIRQIGARVRDGSASVPPEGEDDEDGDENSEAEMDTKRRRHSNDRSRSTSRRVIKKEEEDMEDDILTSGQNSSATTVLDSDMVWQRMNELYDLDGLEELEDAAVDNEDYSPFMDAPPPSLVTVRSRKAIGDKVKAEPMFGFGSSLVKLPESNQSKSSGRQQQQKKSRSKAAQDEEEEEDEERQISEFQLGPWEEYEEIIAPRRLKTYAPEETNNSESDGELSEPSVEVKALENVDEEDEENVDGEEEEAEDDDDDEEGEEEEEGDEEEGEEDEDEEEEVEEEDKRSSKRKSVASHSNKRTPAATRQKRGSAANIPSSPTATPSTRTSRSSVKPRRSGRR